MKKQSSGFSLVEMIAVLVILGLVGAAGTMGFADAIRGYVFAEDTMDMAQKAMATMNRISTELTHLAYNPPASFEDLHDDALAVGYEVTASSDTSISFNANYGQNRGTATNVTIAWANNQLTVNGNLLCDQVTAFDFDYLTAHDDTNPASSFTPIGTRIVEVEFDITGTSGETQTFSTRIVPKFPY